jgi:tRNA(Ile)-lysidine synthase TilS/MesJ
MVDSTKRIHVLESDVGDLKVEVGKIQVTLNQSEKLAEERHESNKTAQLEIKELIKHRIQMDQERTKQEAEARLGRQKILQNVLNPQTVLIILAIILGSVGISVSDIYALSSADPPSAESP